MEGGVVRADLGCKVDVVKIVCGFVMVCMVL